MVNEKDKDIRNDEEDVVHVRDMGTQNGFVVAKENPFQAPRRMVAVLLRALRAG